MSIIFIFKEQNTLHLYKNSPYKRIMKGKKRRILTITLSALAVLSGILLVFFLSNPKNAKCVGEISTPNGYVRTEVSSNSFASYLRHLPLKKRGSLVHLTNGRLAKLQILSYAVIDMNILNNMEQCADAVMRLRAEYLWSQKRFSEIRFTTLAGATLTYQGGDSREAFEKYLKQVFDLCNTTSLYKELSPRKFSEVEVGDVLVYPSRKKGKYGHALIVVDVAVNAEGKRAVMLAESNTPAREKHILRNPNPFDNPWFFIDGDDKDFKASFFTYHPNELRHF